MSLGLIDVVWAGSARQRVRSDLMPSYAGSTLDARLTGAHLRYGHLRRCEDQLGKPGGYFRIAATPYWPHLGR